MGRTEVNDSKKMSRKRHEKEGVLKGKDRTHQRRRAITANGNTETWNLLVIQVTKIGK